MYILQVVADLQHHEKCMEERHQQNIKPSRIIYTTWKVDGATPMYWFIMALTKPPFWELPIYFHHGVRKVDTLLQAPFGDFGQILRIDVSESGWPMLLRRGELIFKPCWRIWRCLWIYRNPFSAAKRIVIPMIFWCWAESWCSKVKTSD